MEACRICAESCRECGFDPHDPRCGICLSVHDVRDRHIGVAYQNCSRCGRTVKTDISGDHSCLDKQKEIVCKQCGGDTFYLSQPEVFIITAKCVRCLDSFTIG